MLIPTRSEMVEPLSPADLLNVLRTVFAAYSTQRTVDTVRGGFQTSFLRNGRTVRPLEMRRLNESRQRGEYYSPASTALSFSVSDFT